MHLRPGSRSEEGFALIAAMLVMLAVVGLSLTAVGLSLHNETASAYDRSHTQSVNAAEAGVDYMNYLLQSSSPSALPCSYNGNVSDILTATYAVTVAYYSAYPPTSGSQLSCPTGSTLGSGTMPVGAVITSVGTSTANVRTMQEQVQLTPVYGGFTDAVFANQLSSSLGGGNNSNNLSITSTGQGSNDANVYVASQPWTCGKNATIFGSVYVQGGITLGNNCSVLGTTWALGDTTLGNNSSVGVDVKSTGNLTINNGATVGRNVIVGGTCSACTTGSGGNVGGSYTPNASIQGPPVQTLPTVAFNAAAWQGAGYTVDTYNGANACSSAASALAGGFGAQATVLRINSSCSLSVPSMTLGANLGIVSDGQLNLGNNPSFSATTQNPVDLSLVIPSADNCSTITSPSIYAKNNLSFSDVDFILFTPCDIQLKNGFTATNNAGGQIYAGGNLNPGNNLVFNFVPVLIPGAGQVTSYNVNTAYLREIVTGSS